jgi:hypothetical protein
MAAHEAAIQSNMIHFRNWPWMAGFNPAMELDERFLSEAEERYGSM